MFENLQSSISQDCWHQSAQKQTAKVRVVHGERSINLETVPVLVDWYQVEFFLQSLSPVVTFSRYWDAVVKGLLKAEGVWDSSFQLDFRNPACQVWLPWLGLGLCACYCWKMGQDTQKLPSCCTQGEKTAVMYTAVCMYVCMIKHFIQEQLVLSLPPLLGVWISVEVWGRVNECCVECTKAKSPRENEENVLTNVGSIKHPTQQ